MSVRLIIGDMREKLRDLPDESVHCVVTSPPYFGLRDYGTALWEGGDPACDHLGEPFRTSAKINENWDGGNDVKNATKRQPFKDVCGKCGATRTDEQIGLEPTPAEFVAVMVEVFREVRRVLRKDGTLWLNLGDSYGAMQGKGFAIDTLNGKGNDQRIKDIAAGNQIKVDTGLRPKNLLGIPWRVAFALQADGWYLRQDIIWSKPNPMPESVTDRCTKAHEYLFLLTKSARYHFDAEAIAETSLRAGDIPGGKGHAQPTAVNDMRTTLGVPRNGPVPETRNKRSVWEVATAPFKKAHFATFPPDLIEPCIKAGCPKDCCAKCGAPVVRMQSRTGPDGETIITAASDRHAKKADGSPIMGNNGYAPPDALERGSFGAKNGLVIKDAAGWSPSCSCDAGLVRGTVLDPFGGAGTTGLVADRLQRDAILIELNPEYITLAGDRITDDAPLFAMVVT